MPTFDPVARSLFCTAHLLVLVLGSACDNCPPGTEMEAGLCQMASTDESSVLDEPVTAQNFEQKFNIRRCQAAEQCMVDEGYDSNFWELVCDEPAEWDDHCPFDLDAAEQCLASEWACDSWGTTIYAIPGPACDDVYRCEG